MSYRGITGGCYSEKWFLTVSPSICSLDHGKPTPDEPERFQLFFTMVGRDVNGQVDQGVGRERSTIAVVTNASSPRLTLKTPVVIYGCYR